MFARHAKLLAVGLLVGSQASAGPSYSLSSLLGGGTVNSENGKLVFSDFVYTPFLNAPSATDIIVKSLNTGIAFGSPVFTLTAPVNFNIQYKVSGVGVLIDGVTMQSTGSGTGTGSASAFKIVENDLNIGLANLTNAFGASTTIGTSSASFDPNAALLIRDGFNALPGEQGSAGLTDVSQTFNTVDTLTAIPSPTAALAGVALLGLVGMRRRRQEATN